MGSADLVLVLRYRKAVTYGFHALLGALETHETRTGYEVRFGETVEATIAEIRSGLGRARRVLVLWSFYSPDAAALAAELAEIKALAPGAVHVAGGVHATAEPVPTLDAGWDVAALGEGESTLLRLVDAGGDPAG
ncbi:MAG TPA: TIGR04013 family B12-binding domain/radical SAM domain-containing protein, partial [Rugosimonospora sp.]|nr:TIGR04013 family B12-binding domain/radical SAM domain-containing protein [Rugosimonospora sp.]